MPAVKHTAIVVANQSFTASINRQRIHVAKGDRFWITSTAVYATNYGVVDLARENKSTRYAFTLENFNRLFDEV